MSEPVDGSHLIEGWSGAAGWARTQYWGFDAKQLPRQGRVWFPDGDGPFPLVLMVHGNHDMEDFSDPGYAYLGELFASRGIIAVSVDENFLNSSFADLVGGFKGGLTKENDARAWMLLEHLRLWRQWNQDPQNRFHGKVDLDRVALIGHSRGGEAVAIAAMFNHLPFYPDDARVAFDYGFNLRGVIAIAPSDEQYEPRSEPTEFDDVSYLVIQGSNDGDVQSYMGSAQYSRVGFADCERLLQDRLLFARRQPRPVQYELGTQRSERRLGTRAESRADHGPGRATQRREGDVRRVSRSRAERSR